MQDGEGHVSATCRRQAMPVIVQVCVVIVTIAVVALVIALVRMADRLSKVTEDIRICLVEVREVTGEPVRRVVDRFERLGTRTAAVSSAFLEEVEAPVRTAVALMRGVKTGTALFMERLGSRFRPGRVATDGGYQYE
jgi:DNA integrity scanning protein DisA with diadenylate cyclase activity